MSVPARLEEQFRVRSYEVEPDGRLRIVVLARMLQEAAWQHAKQLGKGFAERESGSLFWVLSRLRIRVHRYPRWGDEFTIRTWPVGTLKALAIRDFSMFDEDGVMGRMTSGWLVVDGSTGRPVRPERLIGDLAVTPSEYEGDLVRLPGLDDGIMGGPRAVEHHDIDQYRHVNNSAYLEWMVDAVAASGEARPGSPTTTDGLEIGTIRELSIDFQKELTHGEHYQTRIHKAGDATECAIVRAADSLSICRARMVWDSDS